MLSFNSYSYFKTACLSMKSGIDLSAAINREKNSFMEKSTFAWPHTIFTHSSRPHLPSSSPWTLDRSAQCSCRARCPIPWCALSSTKDRRPDCGCRLCRRLGMWIFSYCFHDKLSIIAKTSRNQWFLIVTMTASWKLDHLFTSPHHFGLIWMCCQDYQ